MNRLRPILLVEDNLHDIQLVTAVLKKNSLANDLVVIRDGAEALDYLFRQGNFQSAAEPMPSVILLDLKMPKVSGLEVLQRIKADDTLKAIPVVMLTSSREETDLINSYQVGANAYVVKPVAYEQFADAIRQTGLFWGFLNEPPPSKPA